MIRLIFICHGNICRSASAEFIAKYLCKKYHLTNFEIISRGVSNEEEGNDIYPPMKTILLQNHLPLTRHYAKKITIEEYWNANIVLAMDQSNLWYLKRLFGDIDKVELLGNYLSDKHDIEDPWYTRNFIKVYQETYQAIDNFLQDYINNKLN